MSAVEITMPYVYMVKNKKTGHWYIGKQGNYRKMIGLNYFTTSVSKHPMATWFQKSFDRDSEELNDWDVKILFQGDDYEEAEEVLIELMGLYHPENNPYSLNFGNMGGSFSTYGMVAVYDKIVGENRSIPQDEYNRRKALDEVVHVLEIPEIQAKSQMTCMNNHGVPHSMQSPAVQAKSRETCMETLGYPNALQSPAIQAKVRETCMKNLGVPYSILSPEVRAKVYDANLKNHGGVHSSQTLEVQAKVRETCMKNLGCASPMQSLIVQANHQAACMKNLGYPSPLQSPEVQAKCRATLMETYGVTNPGQLASIEIIAFICVDGILKVIGRFPSRSVASKSAFVNRAGIGVAYNNPDTKVAGLFSIELNSFVKIKLGSNVKFSLP